MKYIDIPAMRRSATILKLCEKPITLKEIAKQIGANLCTIRTHLKKLQDAQAIHIAFWGSVSTNYKGDPAREYMATVPYYVAGNGQNATKPVTKSWQRSKKYRDKLKSGYTPVKKVEPEKKPTVHKFSKQTWVSQLYAA